MVDATVAKQQASGGVPLPKHFFSERHAFFAAFGSRETEELANGEIA